eukprot:CAMPEP_0197895298 /NCGR_PEP_ID=MMETSP1439-20131203/36941_1 /TAXON_ID=66791 /ORGANISM="Gonyaulax spinifera, Strain CCMP409" /LENGTH=134 /DNA_ID=CAMNT_0043515723 /DNA_START=63 /DNA_END=467 /DNA_ORIENTATION=+
MAPKGKAQAKGKAKAKAKAGAAKEAPSPKKGSATTTGSGLDIEAVQKILERWAEAKKQQEAAGKEIEACKTQVESTMLSTGMTTIKTASYEVSKRMQSRESVSKADLPADIWKKYAKTSEFSVLSFKDLGKKKK